MRDSRSPCKSHIFLPSSLADRVELFTPSSNVNGDGPTDLGNNARPKTFAIWECLMNLFLYVVLKS